MAEADSLETRLQQLIQSGHCDDSTTPIDAPINTDFVPVTKRTVAYIVCGIIINDKDEILMMQEAKSECYGRWYLPAGRMEVGETLEEAVKREVLEETGIEFEPATLLCAQCASMYWYRFSFIGTAIGGRLKTPAQEDAESIQAGWFPVDKVVNLSEDVPLRHRDILELIKAGVKYKSSQSRHANLLPVVKPHKHLLLRIALVHARETDVSILVASKPYPHLPTGMISDTDTSLLVPMFRTLQMAFGKMDFNPVILGVLGLEYSGVEKKKLRDGMCLTILTRVPVDRAELPKMLVEAEYEWVALQNSEMKQVVTEKMQDRRCVPLHLLM